MATKTVVRYRNAPRKKTRRRKSGFTVPIAVAAPIAMIGARAIKEASEHGVSDGMNVLTKGLIGYQSDPNYPAWKLGRMKEGMLPILIGAVVHKVAGKVGINRALAQAGIPFVRV